MLEQAVGYLIAAGIGAVAVYREMAHRRYQGMREGLHIASHGFTPEELWGPCPFRGDDSALTCEVAAKMAVGLVDEARKRTP